MCSELLDRALRYPYEAPLSSYVFVDGEAAEVEFTTEGRKPVLAIGSNGSPVQLLRKFGRESRPIPVTRAYVEDHVVVYSAHFTSYGSLPAMLYRLAGAHAYMFVTWLDDGQLERMHETEISAANYQFVNASDISVVLEDGRPLDNVGVYVGQRGPLRSRGTPIRLAEMPSVVGMSALGPKPPRLTQRAALGHVHTRLDPELEFESFVGRVVADSGYRQEMSARLSELR